MVLPRWSIKLLGCIKLWCLEVLTPCCFCVAIRYVLLVSDQGKGVKGVDGSHRDYDTNTG